MGLKENGKLVQYESLIDLVIDILPDILNWFKNMMLLYKIVLPIFLFFKFDKNESNKIKLLKIKINIVTIAFWFIIIFKNICL